MGRKPAIWVVGVVGLAAVVASWWWQRRGSSGTARQGASSALNELGSAIADLRARQAVDPQRLPEASLSGAVTTGEGAPIRGARVCAVPSSEEPGTRPIGPPSCRKTDDHGRYLFEELVPGYYTVHAQAEGRSPASFEREKGRAALLQLEAAGEVTGIDLVLQGGGAEVEGVVEDIGGGPIAGAWVFLGPTVTRKRDGGSAVVVSGRDGKFRAWMAPGPVWAHARAEGYADGYESGLAPDARLRVLLTPESVLAGRVIEAEGEEPVNYAEVRVSGRRARTDRGGHFRIEGLRPGRYKPVAKTVGLYGEAGQSFFLGLGETVEGITVEVHPANVVTGRVVMADESSPCDHGSVTLIDRGGSHMESARVDREGRVEFEAVLSGTYDVWVKCEDYPTRKDYDEVVVDGEDVLGLEWRVEPGARISGKVVTKDGAPVPKSSVSARRIGGPPRKRSPVGSDVTGKEGGFELKGLAAGTYRFRVYGPYMVPQYLGSGGGEPVEVDIAPGGEATAVIEVEGAGRIEGAVVEHNGDPVAQGGVLVVRDGVPSRGTDFRRGVFEIGGLRPGDVTVYAGPRDILHQRNPEAVEGSDGKSVTVRVGQTAQLRLVLDRETGEIRGRVLDERGEPVGDAFVDAQRERDSDADSAKRELRYYRDPMLTDPDGRFVLGGLAKGAYTVRAYRRGGGEAFAEHVALGERTELIIRPTGSLSGHVSLPGGDAPAEFDVSIKDDRTGFSRSEGFYRTGGAWAMQGLPAGDFILSVEATEGTGTREVSVTEGEEKTGIDLRLAPRGHVTGTVVAMDNGKPLAGYSVRAKSVRGDLAGISNADRKNVSDEDGRFKLGGLPPGQVWLEASARGRKNSGYLIGRKLVTVPEGGAIDVGTLEVARWLKAAGDLGFTPEWVFRKGPVAKQRIKVDDVRPGGPADKAGLRPGDVILAVDGRDVTGAKAWTFAPLSRVPPGERVKLSLERGETVSVPARSRR